MWLSLVERCVRDAKAAGSNPVIPTKMKPLELQQFQGFCYVENIAKRYPQNHDISALRSACHER